MMKRVPPRLLLHVGYPKTGSTWLQRVVLDSGRFGFLPWGLDGSEQRARILWQADMLEYDVEELRHRYLEQLRPDVPEDAWVALSSEGFSGNLFFGGRNSAWNAQVLGEMFPHARILLVVREQRSMILSAYGQYVKKGGLLNLSRFLRGSNNKSIVFFDLRHLEYDRMIRLYRQVFGEARVLALPYELIAASPQRFVLALRQFVGVEGDFEAPPDVRLNVARDALALALMRRLNYLRRSGSLNGFSPLASKTSARLVDGMCRTLSSAVFATKSAAIRSRWQQEIERTVERRFAESNRRLAEMTGLRLSEFGYELPRQERGLEGEQSAA